MTIMTCIWQMNLMFKVIKDGGVGRNGSSIAVSLFAICDSRRRLLANFIKKSGLLFNYKFMCILLRLFVDVL